MREHRIFNTEAKVVATLICVCCKYKCSRQAPRVLNQDALASHQSRASSREYISPPPHKPTKCHATFWQGDPPMNSLDSLLKRNKDFAASQSAARELMPRALPNVKAIIIGCADMRVDPAHVLGIKPGEAVVMRNIGGRITPGLLEQLGLLGRIGEVAEAIPGGGGEFHLIVMQHANCGITYLAGDPAMLSRYFQIQATSTATAARGSVTYWLRSSCRPRRSAPRRKYHASLKGPASDRDSVLRGRGVERRSGRSRAGESSFNDGISQNPHPGRKGRGQGWGNLS